MIVLPIGIEVHVAIADRARPSSSARSDDASGAIVAVEAARLHLVADGRIERAAALLGDRQRELDRFVQHRAHRHRDAGLRGQLHQLALRIEPAAARLDLAEPVERALDRRVSLHGPLSTDPRPRPRWSRSSPSDRDGCVHFALERASTTA